MTEQYKRKPNTKCLICEKAIYKRPSQVEKNNGNIFCSVKCSGIFCRKEIPCIVCGKLILAGLNKKTCSRGCSNKNRVGIVYKTGRLKDKVITARAIKIRLISTKGGLCERCGYDKIPILQVHHRNRNRKDNSLKNLELICPNCHYEEHLLSKNLTI